MKRWLIWGGFTVAWTIMLLLPGSEYKKAGVEEWNPTVKTLVAKSIHVLAYGLYAFLSGWLSLPARFRWMPLLFIMAHAAITELIQQHIPGRSGCLEDVALNHIGILLGVIVGWKWWTNPK